MSAPMLELKNVTKTYRVKQGLFGNVRINQHTGM